MPTRSAALPTMKLPTGARPRKAIVNSAITRPRKSLFTAVWISVLLPATHSRIAKPSTTRIGTLSHRLPDSANPASATPAAGAARPTSAVRPTVSVRRASSTAPDSAPAPAQPISRPNRRASPPKISFAKSGISTA